MFPYLYIVLPSYAVFSFIGSFVAVVFVYFRIDEIQMKFNDFLKGVILCILSALLGSKILYMFTRILYLVDNFSIYNLAKMFLSSGYVYFGGLFGVLLAIKIYVINIKKYDSYNIFNMIAPAIPLFHGFGRIGCFGAGCCYGIELESEKSIFGMIQITRVPTQIIEAIFEFMFFLFLIIIERKRRFDELKTYLIGYAVFRFCIEFFRGDEIRGMYFGLSTAQWISIVIILHYILSWFKVRKSNALTVNT